jgi:hypothetical protein
MCRGTENHDCDCPKHRDPKECTPEQIAECHPEGGHPCEEKSDEERSKTGRA